MEDEIQPLDEVESNETGRVYYKSVIYNKQLYEAGDIVLVRGEMMENWHAVLERIFYDTERRHFYLQLRWFYRWGHLDVFPDYCREYMQTELFYSFHLDENSIDTLVDITSVKFLRFEETPPNSGAFVRCIYDNRKDEFYKISKLSTDLPEVKKDNRAYTEIVKLLKKTKVKAQRP